VTFHELDLCSGCAGLALGLQRAGWRSVCYVENDRYCQRLLQARMQDGSLNTAPIWDDLRVFDGRPWRGCVDLVSAGFPCQPVSCAGKRKGAADERWLWPGVVRVVREVGPRYVLLENVPGLLIRGYGFGDVLGELAALGYDAEWQCLPAAAFGAPHLRYRVFVIAYAAGRREERLPEGPRRDREGAPDAHRPRQARPASHANGARRGQWADQSQPESGSRGPANAGVGREDASYSQEQRLPLGDPGAKRCYGRQARGFATRLGRGERSMVYPEATSFDAATLRTDWWEAEPGVCGVVDGCPQRVDRIRALGNAVLPQIGEWLGGRIIAHMTAEEGC